MTLRVRLPCFLLGLGLLCAMLPLALTQTLNQMCTNYVDDAGFLEFYCTGGFSCFAESECLVSSGEPCERDSDCYPTDYPNELVGQCIGGYCKAGEGGM